MASSRPKNYPTLYEYYTSDVISNGLSATERNFTLNDKLISIYSGALHYFRVPPPYWRDRLKKIRAAGLNAVETYVPWNLHEPETGVFDFGQGDTEFTEFLDLKRFLQIAQEEDLFTIVRPGPYICAEWEFGGLPSWLLRFPNMKIRTSDSQFMEFVRKYFNVLLSILSPLQFTKGGSIIALQIENEYGNTKLGNEPVDTGYLLQLKQILEDNHIVELLFTSDTPSNGFSGTLPNVLATANFQKDAASELTLLKNHQPDKPLMVMEYWTGWYDHWLEHHHTVSTEAFSAVLQEILKMDSSVNMYMFHGGTTWGFLNGANIKDSSTDNSAYQPDTSSYDYDAPLSEAGDYTDKYFNVKKLIALYNKINTKIPDPPPLNKRLLHPTLVIKEKLTIENLIKQAEHIVQSKNLLPMEKLNINNNCGQSYGYIVYRKENISIPANSVLKFEGRICDSVMVLVNGVLKSKSLENRNDLNEFGYWKSVNSSLNLGFQSYENATLDLIVENWGRNNFGKLNQFKQYKGLWQGNVLMNDGILEDWLIIPIEFKKKWTTSLKYWNQNMDFSTGPALYKSVLNVSDLGDSYIDMREWTKGIVIVNGFVLTRYLKLGPQQTAFLPGPFLRKGNNDIIIFEHFTPSKSMKFARDPIFETVT